MADSPSELIDQRIAELADWRGETLGRVRRSSRRPIPSVVEVEVAGRPVWSHDGIICTGESYKKVVKLTFAKGASLKDRPASSTRVSTETPAVRSTSTKENKSTPTPSGPIHAAVALNESR